MTRMRSVPFWMDAIKMTGRDFWFLASITFNGIAPNSDFQSPLAPAHDAVASFSIIHPEERAEAPVTRIPRVHALMALLATAALSLPLLGGAQVAEAQGATRNVLFVVDVSGSMAGTPLAQAKQALTQSISEIDPGIGVGLRSYSGSCGNSGVLRVPVAIDNRQELAQATGLLSAGGGTPTPDALRAAVNDLPAGGTNSIVLISDGASTCGNPCTVMAGLVESGVNLTVHTVGFNAPANAEAELKCIADTTGGKYFSADDVDGLAAAVSSATSQDNTKHVGLGDSYSSGFGVSPYETGTNADAGPNECQRSDKAWAQLVAQEGSLDLDFHACQGAVTQDFLEPRNDTWGEVAQIDHLSSDTDLVTFSIGGNDAQFGYVYEECFWGMELLPWNTCYTDEKVLDPVAYGLKRLNNEQADEIDRMPEKDIVPFDELYKEILDEASRASVVTVGYPHFFTEEGNGGSVDRCEGVKVADQRWMMEKTDEMNKIIEENARRNGFVYAYADFAGHELCGPDEDWIFPVLSAGRIHPNADGHEAIADAVTEALKNDGFERFEILPQQVVEYQINVTGDRPWFSIVTRWPGSDVSTSLVSPSGRVIDRGTQADNVRRTTDDTYEQVEVDDPESGIWTIRIKGEDVAVTGEPVTLSTYLAEPENQRPVPLISYQVRGDTYYFDGSGSSDSDGRVVDFDWYISTDTEDRALTGVTASAPETAVSGRSVTLVVTDDRGLTAFSTIRLLPIDVMPGSDVNPIKLSSKGQTPVAILATESLDPFILPFDQLTAGPSHAKSADKRATGSDVNGDGLVDLVLHFPTQSLGLKQTDKELCVDGKLPNGDPFVACQAIRVQ